MQNPQLNKELQPFTIYSYNNHTNIPWNDPQYNPVREYLDPVAQMTQRKYKQQKKGEKDTKYLTRRGFYMDYHIKTVKALPSPGDHTLKDFFDQTDNKKMGKKNKIDNNLKKYTYLERIQMEQKNRSTPAPGSYSLRKTEDQIKEQIKVWKTKKRYIGQKHFFYQQFQNLSNNVPGMGSYNPHLQVPHIKVQKKDHKFWVEKHKKQNQSFDKKRLSEPDPGSYSPCPLDVITFDRIKTADLINKRKKNIKTTGFGTDAKFPYERAKKKVINQERPAPCNYNTMIQWKGKNMQIRKNNWVRTRSTGFSQRIYN